jgi:acyl-CoA synthetase (AMP-forming)/AMP-acid ligase II
MRLKREFTRSMVDLLRNRAAAQPDGRAFTFLDDGEVEGARIQWRELEERSRAIAAAIRCRVPPGSRVLVMCSPSIDFVPAFFGVLYSGCVAVPTYPPSGTRGDRTLARLRGMIADAGVTLILAPGALRERAALLLPLVPELAGVEWLELDGIPPNASDSFSDPHCTPESLALLQYTSGSTAVPRGVMVSHGNLLHNLALSARLAGHAADSAALSWLPVNHDMGLIDGVLQPVFSGYPAYLMSPAAFLQRPGRWLQAISRLQITHSGGPNFAYDLCTRRVSAAESDGLDLSGWRVAYNGSEPVRRSTLVSFQRAFGARGFQWDAFRPAYGLAEATLLVTGTRPGEPPPCLEVDAAALERHVVQPGSGTSARTLVASGTLDSTTRILIVDPVRRTRVASDRVGEIWVMSDSVALGYWNQPEESERTFTARTADSGDGPFLRTGDLGFVRDGRLFVTGRLKDMLIVRGLKHYPHDLELTAEQSHAAIRPGCCAAFAIERGGEERIALVAEVDARPTDNGSPLTDVSAAIAAVRRTIAESHHVALAAVALVAAGTLPKTTSGKLQRYLCREAFASGTLPNLAAWDDEADMDRVAS